MRKINEYNTSKSKVVVIKGKNLNLFLKEANITELQGYLLINPFYNVSSFGFQYDKYIVYELIKDFKNKTLNDYLYSEHKLMKLDTIYNQYNNSLNQTLCLVEEKYCRQKYYFLDRVYILEKYIKELKFNKIIYNEISYDLHKILLEIIANIKKEKKIYAFISQGDPTDTNITITGYFTDFELAGFNGLVSEFSIYCISLLSHGRYFYPKYNKKAYVLNKQIIKKYDKLKMEINYHAMNKTINIDFFNLKLPIKNKIALLDYINIFLNNRQYEVYKEDFNNLKYYLCMRLLTPINILNMTEEDLVIILTLLIIIFTNIDNLKTLKEYIEREREYDL